MTAADVWRALRCLFGHDWHPYFYPRSDGWFSGPHWRRECVRCDKDEAIRSES